MCLAHMFARFSLTDTARSLHLERENPPISFVSFSSQTPAAMIAFTASDKNLASLRKWFLYSGWRFSHGPGSMFPFSKLHFRHAVTRFDGLSKTLRFIPTSRHREIGTT